VSLPTIRTNPLFLLRLTASPVSNRDANTPIAASVSHVGAVPRAEPSRAHRRQPGVSFHFPLALLTGAEGSGLPRYCLQRVRT
jgi:hypothetical protein